MAQQTKLEDFTKIEPLQSPILVYSCGQ